MRASWPRYESITGSDQQTVFQTIERTSRHLSLSLQIKKGDCGALGTNDFDLDCINVPLLPIHSFTMVLLRSEIRVNPHGLVYSSVIYVYLTNTSTATSKI